MADFGLQIEPQFGFSYEQVRDLARSCRAHGFTSIWASDHFMLARDDTERNCLDCWTLLAALAGDVKDIRIGSLVTCMSYRNPAVMAKIAASVDLISEGRLEFGVGAGWKDIEYEAYGIPFPPPGERVDRFLEGIQIIKSLWTQPKTTFKGRYHFVEDAVSAPKPVQAPHPPIMIGGSRPRMLRAMAQHADAVNMLGTRGPAEYADLLARLEVYCDEEGTSYDQLRKTNMMTFVVAETELELDRVVQAVAASEGLAPDEYRARRQRAFIGTTDAAIDLLRQYTDLGVTQFQVVFPFEDEKRSMKVFAEHIIPKLS